MPIYFIMRWSTEFARPAGKGMRGVVSLSCLLLFFLFLGIVNAAYAEDSGSLEWRLAELTELDGVNPYAAYAASTTCGVPLATIASARSRRSPMDDCTYMVLDIMSPYLLMTDGNLDQAHFDQAIASILQTGSSGIGSSNPIAEAQLVAAVRKANAKIESNIRKATQAFQSAAALNASTVSFAMATVGEEAIAPIDMGAGPSGPCQTTG